MTTIIAYLLTLISVFGLYPSTFIVRDVVPLENENWNLYLEDSNGEVWVYESEDGDCEPGDWYSAIMYDNGTPEIYDDAILKLHYERLDLILD